MASSELLKQIQGGKKLKKTETNDRSAPVLENRPSGAGAGPRAPTSAPAIPSGGGPPQLGGLFAGGMPKLKPAGQGNLAKPPSLGKPPAVPGRVTSSAAPPAPSAPHPPSRSTPPKPSAPASLPPPATALPTRAPPVLPSRAPAIPARVPPLPARGTPSPPPAPPAPRRPPPPPRIASPTAPSQAHPPLLARLPPSVAIRSTPPADASSPPARVAPFPPPRPSNSLPTRKAPPPPPARPFSVGGSLPSRAALPPPPPARRPPTADAPPVLSVHMRALSEAESSAAPPLPGPSPARVSLLSPSVSSLPSSQRQRVASTPSLSEAPSRLFAAPPNRQMNGTRPSAPTRKIPSPPPEGGSRRFPTSDFPPPRLFTPEAKHYGGGRKRGSDFDLSNI